MLNVGGGTVELFPAVVTFTVDIKVGDSLRLDGYEIECKRPINAGESISSILVGGSTGYAILYRLRLRMELGYEQLHAISDRVQ